MSKQIQTQQENPLIDKESTDQIICGIIMPISSSDNYTAQHWSDVKQILEDAIIDGKFRPNLVSDADDVGIIHNRIVKNLAENPIVVCDVSSKNPNVMFELGLRLAFDKATIIIKDELTSYNFDTSPIEHLTYPSDLHYHKIIEFKKKLKDKIIKTYEASKDSSYSTFLGHFVKYKVKLQEKEVDFQDFISSKIDILSEGINQLKRNKYSESSSNLGFVSGISVTISRIVREYLRSLNEPSYFFSKPIKEQVDVIINEISRVRPLILERYHSSRVNDTIIRYLTIEKEKLSTDI